MKVKEVIDLIKKNNIQFIGCGVTPLHVYGICASFRYLKEHCGVKKGIVLLAPHSTTGRIIHYEEFDMYKEELYYNDVDSLYLESIKGGIMDRFYAFHKIGKKNYNEDIYIAWTEINYRWINLIEQAFPRKKVIYISIDDGGGSYVNKTKDTLQVRMYENQNCTKLKKFWIIAKTYLDGYYNSIFKNRLIKNNRFLNFNIFYYCRDGQLKRNNNSAPYYVCEFSKNNKYKNLQEIQIFSNSFLINTQCLVENKITDGIVDLKLYSKVVTMIKNNGGTVVIKPHPRELDINKYKNMGCEIYIDNIIPQEVILAVLHKKPKCIISIFSSTLLNAYGLFNIPIISLAKLMLNENINLIFKEQLEDFIEQYDGIFSFPETDMELEKQLKILNK